MKIFSFPLRPVSFNFLNKAGLRIGINKRNEIGMGRSHPDPFGCHSYVGAIQTGKADLIKILNYDHQYVEKLES